MAKKLKIVLAQLNAHVGDIQGNLQKCIAAANKARDEFQADLIIFPELMLTGYPPEDLLLRKSFIEETNAAVTQFMSEVKDIYCLLGHPKSSSHGLLNAASLIYNNTVVGRYAKQNLPNYGVFDEARYFAPGDTPCIVSVKGISVGLIICEDLWHIQPIQQAANLGARLILSPNASPYEIDKHESRCQLLAKRAKSAKCPIIYVNMVGGQDDLIFDGGSMIVNQEGKICQFAGFFAEKLLPVEIEISSADTMIPTQEIHIPPTDERVYSALVLGVRDYVRKNNFPGVLVGVSGGIDSALTLAVAVDALGADKVKAIILPSRYTSKESMKYAMTLVKNFAVTFETISIEDSFTSFLKNLQANFKEKLHDLTEQNLQARCRGVLMMAISNESGYLVLITGNRSEMAVGYATLYGDMAGGLAVLKDVPKTLVYRLAAFRNQKSEMIPAGIISRAPTAELALNQKDEDSLPPYAILDKILELYLNQELDRDEIIAQGFETDTVNKVIKLIKKSEYKRRQAPIGIRINHKSFIRDWRYPINLKY